MCILVIWMQAYCCWFNLDRKSISEIVCDSVVGQPSATVELYLQCNPKVHVSLCFFVTLFCNRFAGSESWW